MGPRRVDQDSSTDRQLIRRMLAGDEQAYEAFFNAYFPRVYRFALPRLNGDVEATRDVVQATLAKAMRKMADFRGESGLFTWVCQICRREAVDYIRARRRYTRNVVPGDPDSSFLMAKLTGESDDIPNESGGDPMPLQIPRLSEQEIGFLETWITNGAQNDAYFATRPRGRSAVNSPGTYAQVSPAMRTSPPTSSRQPMRMCFWWPRGGQ